jgi:hypothetical protein
LRSHKTAENRESNNRGSSKHLTPRGIPATGLKRLPENRDLSEEFAAELGGEKTGCELGLKTRLKP